MDFNEYQIAAVKTGDYPEIGENLVYPALGLAGEAGETADKIKKYWRNDGKKAGKDLTEDQKTALVYEIGDVLWYLAALSEELQTPLGTVAELNIRKLNDRKNRGVIKSQGDTR